MTYDPQTSDNPIYIAALQRAHDEGICVTLLESWGAHVTSSKGGEGFYTVRFEKYTTTCNCSAGQAGTYCKHRALVHEARVQKIQAREAGRALAAPAVADRDPWGGAVMTDRNWKDQYASDVLDLDSPDPVATAQVNGIFHTHTPKAPKTPKYGLPRDGYYTVVRADGSHLTIRIHTPGNRSSYEGQHIASYLYGPQNDSDYSGFAFLTDDGDIRMWGRFKANDELRMALGVILSKESAEKAGLLYAMESNHCCRCGRLLTVPASINMGMGPECASKAM